jgi:hypothetical protein
MPLHKKKENTSASNYCPVSILPSPSKILEEVVRKQLVSHLDTHGIIPNSQYGFRAGRSTSAALGAAHFDWKNARAEGEKVGALFFDLSAAFDLIDVDLLTGKLDIY